jgi:hypothetical protein
MHHSGKILLKSKMVRASDQFLVGQHTRITHGNGHIVRQFSPLPIAFPPCATITFLILYPTVNFFQRLTFILLGISLGLLQ